MPAEPAPRATVVPQQTSGGTPLVRDKSATSKRQGCHQAVVQGASFGPLDDRDRAARENMCDPRKDMSANCTPVPFESVDPASHPDLNACDAWRWLRAEQPVAWVAPTTERRGFWMLTKYNDIAAAYVMPELSSAQGNMLDTLTSGGDPAGGRMLVVMDPPRHTHVKRILQDGFIRAMPSIEQSLQLEASRLVGDAIERGACEFASEIAAKIPVIAACELLGVPESDREHILELTMAVMAGDDGTDTASGQAAGARREILMYFTQLLARRREASTQDVVSLMAGVQVEGEPLTDTEIVLNCYNLIIGGDETCRLSTAGGLLALIEHPSQWEKLKGSAAAVSSAVREILRWTTPATHMCRVATQDIRIRDRAISEGEIVTLWNVSANRDSEVFTEPYTFDILRSPNRHLAFGGGPHSCLGGRLSKIILTVVIRALREQVKDIELAGEPQWTRSTFVAGLTELPVRLLA